MDFKRYQISPGFHFNFINEDKFKSEGLFILFTSPLSAYSASNNALLSNVLMRGCKKYPELKLISRKLDDLYDSSLSPVCLKRGENHSIGFSISSLKSKFLFEKSDIFSEALELLYELLAYPLITENGFVEDYVKSEKSNLNDMIASKINDKVSYAPYKCIQHMCDGEAYAVDESGEFEEIEKITPRSLFDYSKKLFSSSPCEIFYIGTSPKEAEKFAHQLSLRFSIEPRSSYTKASCHRTTDIKRITENFPVSQGKLSIGYNINKRISDGDFHIYTLFSEIFSSSPSSRLFKNVREKLSLCYYCRASTDSHKGIAVVSSGIENKNALKTEQAIDSQLYEIASGKFDEDELNLAKKTLFCAYRELYDSPAGLINWYFNRITAGGDKLIISPFENSQKILSVTKEQIMSCAQNIKKDTVYFMKGSQIDE